MLNKLFVDHLQEIGESYGAHLRRATRFGGRAVLAGAACLVHAVVPGLFTDTLSRAIRSLHQELPRP